MQGNDPSLYHFAHRLAKLLHEMYKDAIAGFMGLEESTTYVLLIGYHKGHEAIYVKFMRPPGDEESLYEVSRVVLEPDLPFGFGSQPILDRIRGYRDDPEIEQHRPSTSYSLRTISRAIGIVKNCILAHYDAVLRLTDPMTASVGGHIHIAQITEAEGFSWAIPPKEI